MRTWLTRKWETGKMSSPFAPERRMFPKPSTRRKKEYRRKI
jgi:hypothetical protein